MGVAGIYLLEKEIPLFECTGQKTPVYWAALRLFDQCNQKSKCYMSGANTLRMA